jgi:hypothetical protein
MKIIQLTSKECPAIKKQYCEFCDYSKTCKTYAGYTKYGNWYIYYFCTKKCLNLWILKYNV